MNSRHKIILDSDFGVDDAMALYFALAHPDIELLGITTTFGNVSTAQAVRNGLAFVELPGRFQIIPGQPTLVLDVAHNPHSVAALAANLDAMGYFPTTHAVFGAMADKDLALMLGKVNPLIDKWYFTDLPTPRAESAAGLSKKWQAQNTRRDASASAYPDPRQALQAAITAADPTDRIVVFGSFYTVGGILKDGVPRLLAKHMPNN